MSCILFIGMSVICILETLLDIRLDSLEFLLGLWIEFLDFLGEFVHHGDSMLEITLVSPLDSLLQDFSSLDFYQVNFDLVIDIRDNDFVLVVDTEGKLCYFLEFFTCLFFGFRDCFSDQRAGNEGSISIFVFDVCRDGWDGNLEEVFFLDSSNELFKLKIVSVVFLVFFPHVSVGFRDSGILEKAVIFRTNFDLDPEVLGDHGKQSSKSVNEHFIDLVELLHEVEVSISEY